MTEVSFISIISQLTIAFQQNREFYDKVDELLGNDASEPFSDHSYLNLVISAIAYGFNNVDAVHDDIEYLFYECNGSLEEYNDKVSMCDDTWLSIKNYHEYYNFLKGL